MSALAGLAASGPGACTPMARKLQQRQQGIRGRGQQKAKGWLAGKAGGRGDSGCKVAFLRHTACYCRDPLQRWQERRRKAAAQGMKAGGQCNMQTQRRRRWWEQAPPLTLPAAAWRWLCLPGAPRELWSARRSRPGWPPAPACMGAMGRQSISRKVGPELGAKRPLAAPRGASDGHIQKDPLTQRSPSSMARRRSRAPERISSGGSCQGEREWLPEAPEPLGSPLAPAVACLPQAAVLPRRCFMEAGPRAAEGAVGL